MQLRSLHPFIDRAEHGWALRLYAGPLGIETVETSTGKSYKLLDLPYFLSGYLEWFVSGASQN